ncbi:hypothetical protein BDV25DRAFT_136139 [Aspergillus avenaceus]|uniref:RNase H type-1 domain-containing protein n=1 Tax=Aspergillus avenaceus TaxID=36643 RepID=A0A5N6U6E0_ASPAV|nr:hypothetical protein BDV25DRAFT_136139 [Aspergillus avenaceus]
MALVKSRNQIVPPFTPTTKRRKTHKPTANEPNQALTAPESQNRKEEKEKEQEKEEGTEQEKEETQNGQEETQTEKEGSQSGKEQSQTGKQTKKKTEQKQQQQQTKSKSEQKRKRKEKEQHRKEYQATFHATLSTRFYGELTADKEDDAIPFAFEQEEQASASRQVMYADASGNWQFASVAVSCRNPDDRSWVDNQYFVTDIVGQKIELGELFGIGAALKLRLEKQRQMGPVATGSGGDELLIFSDSHSAMRLIIAYDKNPFKVKQDKAPLAQKVCLLSHQLWLLGVKVRIHWVPGHPKRGKSPQGHKRVDLLCSKAVDGAKPKTSSYLDC